VPVRVGFLVLAILAVLVILFMERLFSEEAR